MIGHPARPIKSGKPSARRDEAGGYRIDASELARAFDWVPREGSQGAPRNPLSPCGTSVVVAVLQGKLALLEQALVREREALAPDREFTTDLRQRLDRSDERVRALLVQPAPAPSLAPAPARGLLVRLLGR